MRRPTTLIVLALLLLLVAAFFLRREARVDAPERSSRPAAAVEAPLPARAAVAPAAERPKPPPPPGPQGPAPSVGRTATCTLRGGVRILGTPPSRKRVKMDAEPNCAALHKGTVLSDDLVVNPYGGVRWAFVHVKSGLQGQPPPAPTEPVILDQIVCVFTPHALGVRIGQPLLIRNSDPLLHTTHGLTFVNPEFNSGMRGGEEHTRNFSKKEVMFRIKCDIHPWMGAWVGVMDHPYFAVTEETGSYAIPDLPAGRYVVEAWHEKYAPVSHEIDVPSGGEMILDFILQKSRE